MLYAATRGYLPVVEYLVERGADLEAKDRVCDVVISCDSEAIPMSHMRTSVTASGWIHSIEVCCNSWSFTGG